MKVRTDFITNSSSSSFVVFGMNITDIPEELRERDIEDRVENTGLRIGGSLYDTIGMEISTLIKKYPDNKIGDIRKIVADEFNAVFGTNFTEKDIYYFEEGWYDG